MCFSQGLSPCYPVFSYHFVNFLNKSGFVYHFETHLNKLKIASNNSIVYRNSKIINVKILFT